MHATCNHDHQIHSKHMSAPKQKEKEIEVRDRETKGEERLKGNM